MPGSFVYKLFTMILGQNYKSNKILLAEAFANCDKLQDADVAAKEKQLIRIKQLIKQMSASVKDEYGSFSEQLRRVS